MTADRELDVLLAAAAGVRDADLPALPEDLLAELRARAGEPASVVAARQLVADADEARTTPGTRRRRRPGRKALARAGAGVLVLAAAWTTAVVVDTPAGDRPPSATPSPAPDPSRPPAGVPLDPPGGLTLVAAEAVTFPYSLDPVPVDLTPVLVRSGGLEGVSGSVEPVVHSARYRSAEDPGFAFSVSPSDPRVPPPGAYEAPPYTEEEVDERGTVAVDGVPAEYVSATFATPDCRDAPATPTQEEEPGQLCSDAYAELYFQRADGLWVGVMGEGDRYGDVAALVAVAESIVDVPQPVALQFGLAPDGWVVSGYESLAHLTLSSAADPTSLSARVGLSVQERWRGYRTADEVVRGMAEGNAVEGVVVNGLPGALVSVPDPFADPGSGGRTWYLGAQFPGGGPLFLFQAPDTLTRADVLAMAEGVTYTP